MEKTASQDPNEPAEPEAAGPRPHNAAPWYASDVSEARALMPPVGTGEEVEEENADDPFRQEAPSYDSGPAADGGSDTQEHGEAAKNNRAVREVIEIVLIVLLVFLLVRSAVQNFKVEGDSMLPTLHPEQYLLVNRALYTRYDANFLGRLFDPGAPSDTRYLFQRPARGDIVVFLPPTDPKAFIKRVVAMEGETVEVRPDYNPVGRPGEPCGGCGVYVNGVLLDEPYVRQTPDYQVPPTLVPPGHVFVLGDNRRNSSDSHIFGPLAVDRVLGVAFMSYLPVESLGFLPPPSYAEIAPATQP
jgi:signal peptidase I